MTKITLRLPDDLYAQVQTAAETAHRSVNGEILWLIERGLEAEQAS